MRDNRISPIVDVPGTMREEPSGRALKHASEPTHSDCDSGYLPSRATWPGRSAFRHFVEGNLTFVNNPKRARKRIWDIDFFQDMESLNSGYYREWKLRWTMICSS